MAEAKAQPTDEPVADFLGRITDPQRRADCQTLVEMMQRASGAPPVMWGTAIVGFGRYRYTYASGRTGDWPVLGFSPRKNYLTLYVLPLMEGDEALLSRLGKHKTSVACLYLKRLSDVDLPTLEAVVASALRRIAPQRVA